MLGKDGHIYLIDFAIHINMFNYAYQKLVFDTLGSQILDNAWKVYHCLSF